LPRISLVIGSAVGGSRLNPEQKYEACRRGSGSAEKKLFSSEVRCSG
jgi:hypothetical protein